LPFGGSQVRKTLEGVDAYSKGMSVTKAGTPRYDIEQKPVNLLRTSLFGQYSVPEARQYFEDPKSVTPVNLEPQIAVTKGGDLKVGGQPKPGIIENTKEKLFPKKPTLDKDVEKTMNLLKSGEISQESARARLRQAVLEDIALKINSDPQANEALKPVYAQGLAKKVKSDIRSVVKDYTLTEKEKEDRVKNILKNFEKSLGSLFGEPKKSGGVSIKSGGVNILKSLGQITGLDGSPLWKWGLDVDLKIGQPVQTPVGGTVIASAYNGGFGNQVKLRGDDGREYWFSHLSQGTKPGTRVNAGQVIGLGGNSGNTIPGKGGDGSHLDLTVLENGRYIPPRQVAQLLKSYA
jgi:murein DD-endopeptidase MepM/ murein hydrolase activator NlpD